MKQLCDKQPVKILEAGYCPDTDQNVQNLLPRQMLAQDPDYRLRGRSTQVRGSAALPTALNPTGAAAIDGNDTASEMQVPSGRMPSP